MVLDRIAMSVGHVKFMPGSSSSGLYPDLSLIEDNSNNGEESTLSPLENQFNGHKVILPIFVLTQVQEILIFKKKLALF